MLKKLLSLSIVCSIGSVQPRAMQQKNPQYIAQPKPVVDSKSPAKPNNYRPASPPQLSAPQKLSYAQALNIIKIKRPDNKVLVNNTFTREFIAFITSLDLPIIQIQALLEAGAHLHVLLTDDDDLDRKILSTLKNSIQTIMQSKSTRPAQQRIEQIIPPVFTPPIVPTVSIKPTKPIISDNPSLVQLQVYYQGNSDGGGAASCGYHTLLRSMQLANGLQGGKTVEELQKKLINPEDIKIYFGQKGTWRQDVIAQRIQGAFRSSLYNKLAEGLRKNVAITDEYARKWHEKYATKNSLNDKIVGLYRSSFGIIADSVIAGLQANNNPLLRVQYLENFKINDDIIRDLIKKGLSRIENATNRQLIQELQDDEMLDRYVDYSKIRENFFARDEMVNWKKIEKEYVQAFHNTSRGKGDWLDDVEMRDLWKTHAKDILISPDIDVDFMTVEDFNRIGNPEIDSVTVDINDKIKPKLHKQQEFFYIFALGTMNQVGDRAIDGHWYSLVLHQNSRGRREYYIMDSIGSNRIRDENTWKIINLIEKK